GGKGRIRRIKNKPSREQWSFRLQLTGQPIDVNTFGEHKQHRE
ncbi:hypothetical protein VN97_g10995, partial [Penicillium thymicola]